MTTFRTGEVPPAWCELTGFETFELGTGESVTRTPDTPAERLIGTGGTVQLRHAGGSLLLKQAQFIDVDPSAGRGPSSASRIRPASCGCAATGEPSWAAAACSA